jgi:trans-aconitate methyltransferase
MQPLTDTEAVALYERERAHGGVWDDGATAAAQLAVAEAELKRWRDGQPVAPFDALRGLLMGLDGVRTVLELGCGAGYYGDVLQSILPNVQYTGCDRSAAMIAVAQQRWPQHTYQVLDATQDIYWFADKHWDVVIEGCSIIHEWQWQKVLECCTRLAGKWVLLHRTPYSKSLCHEWYEHDAYGRKCFAQQFTVTEIHAAMLGWTCVYAKMVSESDVYVLLSTLWRRMTSGGMEATAGESRQDA